MADESLAISGNFCFDMLPTYKSIFKIFHVDEWSTNDDFPAKENNISDDFNDDLIATANESVTTKAYYSPNTSF